VPIPPKFHKDIRLLGNDYRKGAYFVTLCTRERRHWFGCIVGAGPDASMEPNDLGRIVLADRNALTAHFPHLRLDQMQLMPDHLHGILVLDGPLVGMATVGGSTLRVDAAGVSDSASARARGPMPGSLGAIIGAFKSGTTFRMNALNGTPGQRYWQLGYHEHNIRSHASEFERIAAYIAQDPSKWR